MLLFFPPPSKACLENRGLFILLCSRGTSGSSQGSVDGRSGREGGSWVSWARSPHKHHCTEAGVWPEGHGRLQSSLSHPLPRNRARTNLRDLIYDFFFCLRRAHRVSACFGLIADGTRSQHRVRLTPSRVSLARWNTLRAFTFLCLFYAAFSFTDIRERQKDIPITAGPNGARSVCLRLGPGCCKDALPGFLTRVFIPAV